MQAFICYRRHDLPLQALIPRRRPPIPHLAFSSLPASTSLPPLQQQPPRRRLISALTSLLRLSQTTLDSLSSILPANSAPSPTTLIPCPFNPTHRLRPPSLFHHTLHCLPSSSSASRFSNSLFQFHGKLCYRSEGVSCWRIYSYRILQAILRLEMSSLCSLPAWLIANSPKYGVVIDEAMSNHIVLLCKLCLKAIVSESVGLANAPGKQEGDKESVLSDRRLECPILVRPNFL
nr:U11/U12 small nuclear ribonucleoprotein 48 kDa protein [Ipomoea batatas]